MSEGGGLDIVGYTLGRELRADPGIQVLGCDRLARRLAIGVHARDRFADQRRRIDGHGQHGTVGQRHQVRLERIIHTPVPPHPREVVMGDVTMEQEFTRALLCAAGAVLDFGVKRFARPNDCESRRAESDWISTGCLSRPVLA